MSHLPRHLVLILIAALGVGVLVGVSDAFSSEGARTDVPESPEELTNRYRYRIEKTLNETKMMRPDCQNCDIFRRSTEGADAYSPECRKRYRDFYKIQDKLESERPEDREIEIRIAFGYMDYLTSVEDLYAATAFATSLRQRCTPGRSACGFRQDPDDAELFTKEVTLLGPDGKRRQRLVKLHLRSSSVTNDERLNRGLHGEEQKEQTERMKRFFEEGFARSDMVLYVGHARDGGGPDFGPPRVNPKTRRTDYGWHRANPSGLRGMAQALKQAKNPAKIVGVFACNASTYFGAPLKAASPKSAYILSGANEFEASVGQAVATLDSVLGLKCSSDFKNSVNVIKDIYDYPIEPVSVDF